MNDQTTKIDSTSTPPAILVGERRAYDLSAAADFDSALRAAVADARAQDTLITADPARRATAEAALASAGKAQLVVTTVASCEIATGSRVLLQSVTHADETAILVGIQRPGMYRVLTPTGVVLVERGEFDVVEGAALKAEALGVRRGAASA